MTGTIAHRVPARAHHAEKPERRGLTTRVRTTDSLHVALLSPLRVLCDALHVALAEEPGVQVVSSRASLSDIAKLCKAEPDIIVLADGSSLDALQLIGSSSRRLAHCRLLVFGLHRKREYNRFCSKVRARGLLPHGARLRELVSAMRSVHRVGLFPSPALAGTTSSSHTNVGSHPSMRLLTQREREIADVLESGLSNAGIARKLGISEHTVKTHVAHILTKLHVHDRAEVGASLDRFERIVTSRRR